MTRAPAAWAMEAVASVLPLSTTMHSAMACQGISVTTWPMDSASFNAGMMMEINGRICFCFRSDSLAVCLAKTHVDIDLGVLWIGCALVVDLEVGLKCSRTAELFRGHGPDELPNFLNNLRYRSSTG